MFSIAVARGRLGSAERRVNVEDGGEDDEQEGGATGEDLA